MFRKDCGTPQEHQNHPLVCVGNVLGGHLSSFSNAQGVVAVAHGFAQKWGCTQKGNSMWNIWEKWWSTLKFCLTVFSDRPILVHSVFQFWIKSTSQNSWHSNCRGFKWQPFLYIYIYYIYRVVVSCNILRWHGGAFTAFLWTWRAMSSCRWGVTMAHNQVALVSFCAQHRIAGWWFGTF